MDFGGEDGEEKALKEECADEEKFSDLFSSNDELMEIFI